MKNVTPRLLNLLILVIFGLLMFTLLPWILQRYPSCETTIIYISNAVGAAFIIWLGRREYLRSKNAFLNRQNDDLGEKYTYFQYQIVLWKEAGDRFLFFIQLTLGAVALLMAIAAIRYLVDFVGALF